MLAQARGELVAVRGRWLRIDEETRAATLEFAEARRGRQPVDRRGARARGHGRRGGRRRGVGLGRPRRSPASSGRPRRERVKTPKTITATLRDYQEDGLAWLAWLEANGLGGILADDMGLGKTAQALAIIAHDLGPSGRQADGADARRRTDVGRRQLAAGGRAVRARRCASLLHHGPARETRRRTSATRTSWSPATASCGATQRLARDRVAPRRARRGPGDQEPDTATAQGGARAARRGTASSLTGTPVENHLGELWSS